MKLTQPQQQRLRRLLFMDYSPRELAHEIGVDEHSVRKSLSTGAPCWRDEKGRIWIVGEEFREWYQTIHKKGKHPMKANEAWCCRCRQPVPMVSPKVCSAQMYTELLRAECPYCQAPIFRLRGLTE